MKIFKTIIAVLVSGALFSTGFSQSIAAEKPRRGGTFVIGTHGDPDTLNPLITSEVTTRIVTGNIFSRLIYSDLEGNFRGDLAQKWTVSKDNLTIQFDLRKGAKWHDGKPVTAEDVKFSLESMAKYHPRGVELKRISKITVLSPTSIEIKFPSPSVSFLPFLDEAGFLLPKHIYGTDKDLTLHPSNAKPLGSGPFIFKEWRKGDHITLVRNKNYYIPDEPYVETAVIKIIPSASSRMLSLENGDIDYVTERDLPDVDAIRLKKHPNFVVTGKGMGPRSLTMIVFNTRRKPWNDLRVRQAIAYAVDRNVMVEKATFGLADPAHSAFSKQGLAWAYNPKVEGLYPQNLARAAQLLDEAGYPVGADGWRFTSTVLCDRGVARTVDIGEILREQLKQLNINLVLQLLDKATSDQRTWIKHDYDLWLGPTTYGSDPSIGIQRYYRTKKGPPAPFTNANAYSNPEVDKLFTLAGSTIDYKKRGQYYRDVQLILMKDLPILPLIDIPKAAAFPKKVKGVHERRFWSYYYAPCDAWFSK